MPVKRLLARPELALFGLVFVAYAYFYQAGGWNQNSRFDLVRAIVEEHSLSIDPYVCMNPHPTGVPHHLNTGDVSCRGPEGRCQVAEKPGERTYCDKAPGVSFLAVPAYALLRASAGEAATTGDFLNRSAHVVTIWTLSLPSALAVSMLFLALVVPSSLLWCAALWMALQVRRAVPELRSLDAPKPERWRRVIPTAFSMWFGRKSICRPRRISTPTRSTLRARWLSSS